MGTKMTFFKTSNKICVSALALTIAIGGSSTAIAQTSDNTEVVDSDIIVVTARKRDETLLEIPVSVSAFAQGDLDKLGITDVATLSDFTPGFKFENEGTAGASGRLNPQIRFRGVGVQASTPSSRAGAIFWDGAFISDGAGIVPLVDLERVEVIKGPQTAFFGRNTFSGAVNYIPAAPTAEFGGRLSGQLSATDNDDGYALTGVVNVPLGDKIRTRLAVTDSRSPGTLEFGDGNALGRYDNTSILGSVHFDLSDNVTFKYSGTYVDAEDTAIQVAQQGQTLLADCDETFTGTTRNLATGETTGSFTTDLSTHALSARFGVPFLATNFQCGEIADFDDVAPDVPPTLVPDDALNSPGFLFQGGFAGLAEEFEEFDGDLGISRPDNFGNNYRYWRNHLSTEINLDSGHTITALASNSRAQSRNVLDALFGSGNAGGAFQVEGVALLTDDVSLEARISSPSDQRFRYSVGASYYDLDSVQGNYGQNSVLIQNGENIGVFGSIDFDITESLTLSGEGRLHEDEQTIEFQGLPNTFADGSDPNAVTDQSQSYTAFNPRVILSYSPNDNLNIYGSWSNSRLQGVPTNAVAFGAANPDSGINENTVGLFTDIQELDAFEIGIKQSLGTNFNYSIAGYFMDWENQVFFQLNNFFQSVFLPGDSEYLGIEAEFDYTPTDWLTLSGGANYVDAEFTDFGASGTLAFARLNPDISPQDQIDATGNRPRYIPAFEATAAAEIDLQSVTGKPSFLRVDGNYTGDFFVDNLEFNEVSGYFKFNARAGINLDENFSLEIFGTNLTDDLSAGTNGGTTGFFSRRFFGGVPNGRENGVRANYDF